MGVSTRLRLIFLFLLSLVVNAQWSSSTITATPGPPYCTPPNVFTQFNSTCVLSYVFASDLESVNLLVYDDQCTELGFASTVKVGGSWFDFTSLLKWVIVFRVRDEDTPGFFWYAGKGYLAEGSGTRCYNSSGVQACEILFNCETRNRVLERNEQQNT